MADWNTILGQAALHWFDEDIIAEAATLNSVSVSVLIRGQGQDSDDNSVFDYLDTSIKLTDYSAVDYRDDTLVYDGTTWRYPRMQKADAVSIDVRWISNEKPKIKSR